MNTGEFKTKELLIGALTMLLLVFLLGASTQNGQLIDNPVKYPGHNQKNYFCTPTGTGDCLSWDTACTFRSAVAKLSSSYTTSIYLSGGIHDANNGSDATGTTISTNYVHIMGAQPPSASPATRLVNSRVAGATHVLRITGSTVMISDIAFGNFDQTDKNVIMLNIRSSGVEIGNCDFTSVTGDGGGTGILVENSSLGTFLHDNNFFGVIDSGIEFGAATDSILSKNNFYAGGKGIYMSSANADRITVQDSQFLGLTTGIDYATAATKSYYFIRCYFGNCTANVAAVVAYGPTWFESITESGQHGATYPAGTGVTVAKDAAAWTWGDKVEIIPAATLTKPFKLTNIHFQGWNAGQTFKIELFYGSAAPAGISLGYHEVLLGDPATNGKVDANIAMDIYIPAYATVSARINSSTAGADNVVVTLGYELL
jgi:hypothetical protein